MKRQIAIHGTTIRESAYSAPGSLTVDREKGIIYGVKIAGRESPNTHGQHGATKGTRYTERAFLDALPLYESALSNKNHNVPSKASPHDSNPDMRIGWFTNVRATPEGVFGDFNVLVSDPLSAKIFEAAERNPRLFAMSHNAYGSGKVIDGWFVIDKIISVDSVDLVADGGTNVSLFESRKRNPMKTTFRQLLEASTNPKVQAFAKKSHVVKLLEMDGLGDSVLDAPTPAEDEAMNWKQHLGEMLKSMVTDEAMDPADIKKKLNAALKLLEEGDKAEGDPTIDVTASDEDGDESDDKKKKKSDETETKESLKKTFDDYKACRRLCESAGLANATEDEVESIQAMPTEAKRKWLIETIKGGKRQAAAPKSQAPGVKVAESKANTNTVFTPLLRG